jgi:predicted nuclease of restriction endonuclease-like (RecB) superfamily
MSSGNWSVRELRRQIASLYYQRSGLSKDKARLSAMAHAAADRLQPAHIIRDPYVFEFLGLRSRDVMAESDLEDALLDRLQDFLLELGHGFCFEARQKRILIGDEHFFIDIVFYHRILKCHILVELKTEAFRHEHLGQLNTYVAYYKKHQMTPGDLPPIGILLCTRKNDALEQQKIAECLSSVDELMAAQARKVDALKTHKKGLMQQLFPREGETQPRLRFPEFQNVITAETQKLEALKTHKKGLMQQLFPSPEEQNTL